MSNDNKPIKQELKESVIALVVIFSLALLSVTVGCATSPDRITVTPERYRAQILDGYIPYVYSTLREAGERVSIPKKWNISIVEPSCKVGSRFGMPHRRSTNMVTQCVGGVTQGIFTTIVADDQLKLQPDVTCGELGHTIREGNDEQGDYEVFRKLGWMR